MATHQEIPENMGLEKSANLTFVGKSQENFGLPVVCYSHKVNNT